MQPVGGFAIGVFRCIPRYLWIAIGSTPGRVGSTALRNTCGTGRGLSRNLPWTRRVFLLSSRINSYHKVAVPNSEGAPEPYIWLCPADDQAKILPGGRTAVLCRERHAIRRSTDPRRHRLPLIWERRWHHPFDQSGSPQRPAVLHGVLFQTRRRSHNVISHYLHRARSPACLAAVGRKPQVLS